jgi:transposase
LKVFCSECVLAHPGEICQSISARGIPSTRRSIIGRKKASGKNSIADKEYDSQTVRAEAEALEMSVIIPIRKNSIKGNKGLDWHLYKLRHLVENAFARPKHYRAVATRYDKLARNYESILLLACAFLWLPM